MLRQVISHKKMLVSLAKFTILISWSPFCIPLIIWSVLMKLAITSIAIIYNSIERRHPWRTRVMVKGSDRKPFILILDSILVYHVNFNYANEFVSISKLMQSRKDKVNSKDITERFFSVYLAHQLCHKSVKLFYF